MEKIRLVALDMDGTLLMPDKSVHPDTIRDINTAEDLQIVYCSGRSVPELAPYTKQLPVMRYAVCMSGAVVYDFQERESIYSAPIERKYIESIIKTAQKFDGMLNFLTEEASIVSKAHIGHVADFGMQDYQEMFLEIATCVDSMEEELKKHAGIPKVNIYFRTPADREAGYQQLKELPLTFAFAEKTSLEMNAEGVSKASGLAFLCDYLQIPMTSTMGIGDADNDRAMLQAVGLSVAMGNAGKEIREICDTVTEDNSHNGVGAAIKKFG